MRASAVPEKPRVGISSCLLGEEVRYDGAHKRNAFIVGELGRHVRWVPLCPEVEVGMGIPREPVRLLSDDERKVRMVGVRTGRDWTDAMTRFAGEWLGSASGSGLSGYLLKASSPSCGPAGVTVHPRGEGASARDGMGLFAAELTGALPDVPVADERCLADAALREHFLTRVFTRARWLQGPVAAPSAAALLEFHTRVRTLILAHDPGAWRRLGTIVAEAGRNGPRDAVPHYGRGLMEALAKPASRRRHARLLRYFMGCVEDDPSPSRPRDVLRTVDAYHAGSGSLAAVRALVGRLLEERGHAWAHGQFYLAPYPADLAHGWPS